MPGTFRDSSNKYTFILFVPTSFWTQKLRSLCFSSFETNTFENCLKVLRFILVQCCIYNHTFASIILVHRIFLNLSEMSFTIPDNYKYQSPYGNCLHIWWTFSRSFTHLFLTQLSQNDIIFSTVLYHSDSFFNPFSDETIRKTFHFHQTNNFLDRLSTCLGMLHRWVANDPLRMHRKSRAVRIGIICGSVCDQ